MIQRLAVIGLGLIGGSFARALRAAGQVQTITGFDLDVQQNDAALKLGVIDVPASSVLAAVKDADVVVLAVPVLHTAQALSSILPGIKSGAVVMDVGSTKQSVLRDVQTVCGELPSWFVACHPIAGKEKSGVAASSAELFRGHRVVLTPHARQDRQAQKLVEKLWLACDARVVEMDPAQHDEVFAATSHLPHVLAYSFVDMLARLDGKQEIFPNAGGGFRDFTRIASSSPQMWHDIVRANSEAVGSLLAQQIEELQRIQQLMQQGQWDELKALFERARAARERYLPHIE